MSEETYLMHYDVQWSTGLFSKALQDAAERLSRRHLKQLFIDMMFIGGEPMSDPPLFHELVWAIALTALQELDV